MTNTQETVAQKALRLLSEVPADKFIKGDFSNNIDSCCAIGHYQRLISKNPADYFSSNCEDLYVSTKGCDLRQVSETFLIEKHNCYGGESIASVNNATSINGYNEPEIKDRVIHLLKDMVDAGY